MEKNMIGLAPGVTTTWSAVTSMPRVCATRPGDGLAQLGQTRGRAVVRGSRSRSAWTAASTMCAGVAKSGSPM